MDQFNRGVRKVRRRSAPPLTGGGGVVRFAAAARSQPHLPPPSFRHKKRLLDDLSGHTGPGFTAIMGEGWACPACLIGAM